MKFRITSEAEIVDDDGNLLATDALESLLDTIMDELMKLGGEDHDLGATLSEGLVELSVTVEASDEVQAVKIGGGIIRTAIHAAQVATPDWSLEHLKWVVETERERDLVDA